MQSPQIFIVSNHLMFSYGLRNLLFEATRFDIAGQEADITKALEQIKTVQPDVVILDNDDDSAAEIISILKASPGTNVISLNLHSNTMRVYRTTQWTAKGVEDLMAAIADCLPSFEADLPPESPAESSAESPPESVDKVDSGVKTEANTHTRQKIHNE